MTGKRVATTTQESYPWKAVLRTVLQAMIALAASAGLIVTAITGQSPEAATGALAVFITVSAAITRLMAVPVINGWLTAVGLGSEPKPKTTPTDPNLTDWHPATPEQ